METCTPRLRKEGIPLPDDLPRKEQVAFLKRKACQIRRQLLQVIHDGGSGHPGGSLSATDLLTVVYFAVLHQKPEDPAWPERDRFVLSKGHACPALYVILAELGYYPKTELKGFRKINRMLQGHPEFGTPGIEVPTGSLGQGFSSSVGIALGLRYLKLSRRVFVLLGDGEAQEGQIWEAALAAGHHKLANLTAMLDYNRMQQDGFLAATREMEPFADKWKAFNWAVKEIDGHDVEQILEGFQWAAGVTERPQMLLAHTVKGKGVSFMEGVPRWHGTQPPSDRELQTAFEELLEEEASIGDSE